MMKATLAALFLVLLSGGRIAAAEQAFEIELDVSEAPELKQWGEDARKLLIEWYPRICNLLPSPGYSPPKKVTLKILNRKEGVAETVGTLIRVSSGWIKQHPEDVGCVVHELAHVVQGYKNAHPGWITEGTADYIRWAIYEGKPLSWYDRPARQGYKQGYRTAAGFFLWLETEKAPGIVNRVNTAMREQKYSDDLFKTHAGKPLDELWDEYVKAGK